MTNFASLLLAVAAIFNFGGFAWAVRGHFVSARMPLGMKVVSALSVIGFLGYLLDIGNATVPPWRIAIAFGLQALAGGLFLWACAATRRTRPEMAFSRSEPTLLFKTGPYRFVRHPFYSSYFMFWLACTLATTSLIVTVITVLLIMIYTAAALREQSIFLKSAFKPQYEADQKTTGLFWPRLLLLSRK
ncbi:MAG TPA: isoprenylcysteine carboxylmethyltransferase family protein [Roseiarcus sp.]|nr:isoprenylcysteine carboxylmethyltransferase family protein [Roseiarcus sp.]